MEKPSPGPEEKEIPAGLNPYEALGEHMDAEADVEGNAIRSVAHEKVKEQLQTLDEREQVVIRKLFGVDEERQYTQQEVAAELGISASRVSQIEAEAIAKLGHPGVIGKIPAERPTGREKIVEWPSRSELFDIFKLNETLPLDDIERQLLVDRHYFHRSVSEISQGLERSGIRITKDQTQRRIRTAERKFQNFLQANKLF